MSEERLKELIELCTTEYPGADVLDDAAEAMRELLRMRAAVPKRIPGATDWGKGWNACVDAFEAGMKSDTEE